MAQHISELKLWSFMESGDLRTQSEVIWESLQK